MTPELWELINWISDYYMTPLGQVAKTVFPKSLSTRYISQKLWFVESRIDIDPLQFGKLKKIETKVELTKVIWEINGVKEVTNKVQISEINNFKNIAKDLASLGEIKAKLMASKELNSLNFSVDVVNNIAYISGIASSDEEIAIVTQLAQEARFIIEVQNFVKVNKDKR